MPAITSQIAALLSILHADASCPVRTGDGSMLGDDGPSCPLLRPKEDTTHKGCKCSGKGPGGLGGGRCSASINHDHARCDWCYTKDKCGSSSLTGHWDYCVYDSMDDFEAQTHTEKRAQLWANITDPSVVGKSGPNNLVATTLKVILTESMITTFDDHWDVLPAGRKKVIHAQGVMCQFDLAVASNSPFTGVLSPGKQSGLIRFGSAASLDEPLDPKIFPGFGIKFLRSGVRSADWVGLRASGAPKGAVLSYNFFDSVFSNHVAPDAALVKLNRFQQASGCIDMVGLSDACTYTQAGEKIAKPVFPFQLMFEPTGNASFPDKKKKNADLLKELSGIPDGTDVFTVYAFASPTDKKQGKKITIGTLTTTGSCHQTLFGDLDLFFRHQRMEEDFALAPEWIAEMKALGDPVCEATVGPASKWQCPPPSDEVVVV